MKNLNVMKTIGSENRPSFNDWCMELKVSSQYVEVNRKEPILRQSLKTELTLWEEFCKLLGL
jgi:hypothetical protein